MIVGIDDSGNFEKDKRILYAAVFIRPRKVEQIRKVFEAWESTLPDTCKSNSEVKGHLLRDEDISYFVEHIMLDNGYGAIKHQVFSIGSSKEDIAALENQRQLHVSQYKEAVEQYKSQGKKFHLIAGQYHQMGQWLDSVSIKTLAKLELLSYTVVKAINLSVITSVVRGFDRELGKLTIKIDEGVVGRKSTKGYWQDVLRNSMWNFSRSEPFVQVDRWKPSHPFLKRFMKYPKSTEKLGVFSDEIRKCMDFYDSKEHFEIRIADIVANIYFRHYGQSKDMSFILPRLSESRIIFTNMITEIKLTKGKNPNPLNPYVDEVGGVTAAELEEKYGNGKI